MITNAPLGGQSGDESRHSFSRENSPPKNVGRGLSTQLPETPPPACLGYDAQRILSERTSLAQNQLPRIREPIGGPANSTRVPAQNETNNNTGNNNTSSNCYSLIRTAYVTDPNFKEVVDLILNFDLKKGEKN